MDSGSPITSGWGKSITVDEEFYLFRNYDSKTGSFLPRNAVSTVHPDKQPGDYPCRGSRCTDKARVLHIPRPRDDVLLPDATIGDQEFKSPLQPGGRGECRPEAHSQCVFAGLWG